MLETRRKYRIRARVRRGFEGEKGGGGGWSERGLSRTGRGRLGGEIEGVERKGVGA